MPSRIVSGPWYADVGLLVLRVFFGMSMLLSHGWPKFVGYSEMMHKFPDPIGVGSSAALVLAIFAEVVCAAALAAGLWTRLALIPLIVTMSVAGFIVHAADPFARKELAFVYLVVYCVLFLTGPGRYAVDRKWQKD